MELNHFKEIEFIRCQPSCSSSDCDSFALRMLDELRDLCGFPIVINSAYRSPDYEKKKGRSGLSSHCKGCAFDLRCYDSRLRADLVRHAFTVGFKRIGIAKTFIHIDCDPDKLTPCIWLYE